MSNWVTSRWTAACFFEATPVLFLPVVKTNMYIQNSWVYTCEARCWFFGNKTKILVDALNVGCITRLAVSPNKSRYTVRFLFARCIPGKCRVLRYIFIRRRKKATLCFKFSIYLACVCCLQSSSSGFHFQCAVLFSEETAVATIASIIRTWLVTSPKLDIMWRGI